MRSKNLKPIPVIQRLVAIVVAERLFVEIAEQMERFDAHIGSTDSAFQEGPEVFESVCVNLAVNVLFGVIYYAMSVVLCEPIIGLQRIAVESRTSSNVVSDLILNRFLFAIGNDCESNFTTALQHSHNDSLILPASSSDPAFADIDVHVAGFSTDKSLVYFDGFPFAAEFQERLALHGETDTVHHEPCRLLSDAESAAYFIGTNPVFAVGDHPQRHEPLVQADRGILENSSDLGAELSMSVNALALPFALISEENHAFAATGRAANTLGPAQQNHELEAIVGVGEVDDGFLKCLWLFHVSHQRQNSLEALICQVYYCPNLGLLLVHEFRSTSLNKDRQAQNADDWQQFVNSFPELDATPCGENQIVGPIEVPGGGLVPGGVPLYLGKLVTHLA
jgi:hypothetical protein